jgi:hypothetical protein
VQHLDTAWLRCKFCCPADHQKHVDVD